MNVYEAKIQYTDHEREIEITLPDGSQYTAIVKIYYEKPDPSVGVGGTISEHTLHNMFDSNGEIISPDIFKEHRDKIHSEIIYQIY